MFIGKRDMNSFIMIHEYGYNICENHGSSFLSLVINVFLLWHLRRFDFLMATSYLVDQTGWEEKVMLTHFGMETNGRQTSENISRTPKYRDSLLPWIVWAVGEFSRGKIKRSKRRLRYKLGCSSSFPFPFFSSCWWKFEASALNVNIFFQRFHSLP